MNANTASATHWLAEFGSGVPEVPWTATPHWPSFVVYQCVADDEASWMWCHAYDMKLLPEFIGMAASVQKAMEYSRQRGWRYGSKGDVLFIRNDGTYFSIPLSWDDEDGA